jgi:hypothetical protein
MIKKLLLLACLFLTLNSYSQEIKTHQATYGVWNSKSHKYDYEDVLNKNLTFNLSDCKISVNDGFNSNYSIKKVVENSDDILKVNCLDNFSKKCTIVYYRKCQCLRIFYNDMVFVYN